jgi:pyruvate/2-oxoglutarate dehydrogenase complex dihydrolipoamide dehydrogenase (E3) component
MSDAPTRGLEPFDEHNQGLGAEVSGMGWDNPKPAARYHLVVVGAGAAGLVTAVGAAGLGAKVALVERRLLGGDCLNFGCVPSKAIIRAARAWREVSRAAEFGAPQADGSGDFPAVMERMRRLRASISPVDGRSRLSGLGIDVFIGEAAFIAGDCLRVGTKELRFKRAVIATGAAPMAPPIPGLEVSGYLTNETVFSLERLPAAMAVIGGGPIGCELAQAFARFGAKVKVVDIADHMLPREDADAAAVVEKSLARDGVEYLGGASIEKVERRGNTTTVAYRLGGERNSVEVDALLVAAGRAPNVEGMGLEEAGVDFLPTGVVVDERLATTNRRVFACGDVSSKYKFTHAADAEARIVIQNALFPLKSSAEGLVVPWCTYTSPELAHVGLYRHEAEARSIAMETVTVQMSEVDRAVLDGDDEGFLRLHVSPRGGRILGATWVAEHAGENIGELTLALKAGLGLGKLASTIHPYPTRSEAVGKAAHAWRRGKLSGRTRKFLSAYFRLI